MHRRKAASEAASDPKSAIIKDIEKLRRQIGKSVQNGKRMDNGAMINEILSLTRKMGEIQASQSRQIAEQVVTQLGTSPPKQPVRRGAHHQQLVAENQASKTRSVIKDALSLIIDSGEIDHTRSSALELVDRSNEVTFGIQLAKREKEMMEKNQALIMSGLQAKILEAQDECLMQSNQLESEIRERKKLEQKNLELSTKLSEARQGLRDMQQALQNVQQSMEQAFIKRDQKDNQIQKLQTENKHLTDKLAQLESNLKDLESSSKSMVSTREALLDQLKEQLSVSQEANYKQTSDAHRLRGEKTLLEADVDALKRKISTLENRFKTVEMEIRSEYQLEIDRVNDKLKVSHEKFENNRVSEALISDLYEEIKEKTNLIKVMEGRNADLDLAKREIESKFAISEGHLKSFESSVQQLQIQLRQCEQDASNYQLEISSLKRSLNHSEEMIKEMAYQLQSVQSERDLLKETVSSQDSKLERMSELQETIKRLRRELDRSAQEVEEHSRRITEQDRTIRIYNEDRLGAESHYKAIQTRLNASINSEQEARQLLAEANNRITELFNTASDLSSKLAFSQQKFDKLERDCLTMNTASAMNSLAYSSEYIMVDGSESADFGGGMFPAKPMPPGNSLNSNANSPRSRMVQNIPSVQMPYNYPPGGKIYVAPQGQYAGNPRGPPNYSGPGGRGGGAGRAPQGRGIQGGRSVGPPNQPQHAPQPGRGSRLTFIAGPHQTKESVSMSVPSSANSVVEDSRPQSDSLLPYVRSNEMGQRSIESNFELHSLDKPLYDQEGAFSSHPTKGSTETGKSVTILDHRIDDDKFDHDDDDPDHKEKHKSHKNGHHSTKSSHHHSDERISSAPTHDKHADGDSHKHHHSSHHSNHHESKSPKASDDNKHKDSVHSNIDNSHDKYGPHTHKHHHSHRSHESGDSDDSSSKHHHRSHKSSEANADEHDGNHHHSHKSIKAEGDERDGHHHHHHHHHHHSKKDDHSDSHHHHSHKSTNSGDSTDSKTPSQSNDSQHDKKVDQHHHKSANDESHEGRHKHHHHHHGQSSKEVGELSDLGSTGNAQADKQISSNDGAPINRSRGAVDASDITQLRSLLGNAVSRRDENEAESKDFGLELIENDHAGNLAKLERFLKHSDKILEDMKAKRAKYHDELDKASDDFEATNGKKPSEAELPQELLNKTNKVSELIWNVQAKIEFAKKELLKIPK